MLSQYGHIYAMELNDMAKELARQSFPDADIRSGFLPENIPFKDKQFDLIVLFDVLEHLQEDARSLDNLHKHLKPNGWLFITVPALLIKHII